MPSFQEAKSADVAPPGSNAASKPAPKQKFKRPVAKPPGSVAEIPNLQKSALVDCINEAKMAEDKRLYDLSRAPPRRKKELEARFEAQRARDKTKIDCLLQDLQAVQQITQLGEVDMSSRIRTGGTLPPGMDADRFRNDVNISWLQRLEHLDKKFENRSTTKYNEYEEKKKVYLFFFLDFLFLKNIYLQLILLKEKREILKDLVNVQSNAIKTMLSESGNMDVPAPLRRRDERARSVSGRSDSSRGSSVSYATFATNHPKAVPPIPRNHNLFETKVQRMVPKLEIGTTVLRAVP
jgi:hypothetical protein